MPSIPKFVGDDGEKRPFLSQLFKRRFGKSSHTVEDISRKDKLNLIERLRSHKGSKRYPNEIIQTAQATSQSDDNSYISSDPSSHGTLKLQTTPDFSSSINETLRDRRVFNSYSSAHTTSYALRVPVEIDVVPRQPAEETRKSTSRESILHISNGLGSATTDRVPQAPGVYQRASSTHRPTRRTRRTTSDPEAFAIDEGISPSSPQEVRTARPGTPVRRVEAVDIARQDFMNKEQPEVVSEESTKTSVDAGNSSVSAYAVEVENYVNKVSEVSELKEYSVATQIQGISEYDDHVDGLSALSKTPTDTQLDELEGTVADQSRDVGADSPDILEVGNIESDDEIISTASTTASDVETSGPQLTTIPLTLLHAIAEFRISEHRMQWLDNRCEYLEGVCRQFEIALKACNDRLRKNRERDPLLYVLLQRDTDLQNAIARIREVYTAADDSRRRFTKACAERARHITDILGDALAPRGYVLQPTADDALVRDDFEDPPANIDMTLLDPNHRRITAPAKELDMPGPSQPSVKYVDSSNESVEHGTLAQGNATLKLSQAQIRCANAEKFHDGFNNWYCRMLYEYKNGDAPIHIQNLSKPEFDEYMFLGQRKNIRELASAQEELALAVAEARDIGVDCWSWDGSTCSSHEQQSTNGYPGMLDEQERRLSDSFQVDMIWKWLNEIEPNDPVDLAQIKSAVHTRARPPTDQDDSSNAGHAVRLESVRTWESIDKKAHGYHKKLIQKWNKAQQMSQPFCNPWTVGEAENLARDGQYTYLKRGLLKADPVMDFCTMSQKRPSEWGLNKVLEG